MSTQLLARPGVSLLARRGDVSTEDSTFTVLPPRRVDPRLRLLRYGTQSTTAENVEIPLLSEA